MNSIDLNSDIGEGAPFDAELLDFITSANICCGVHAGSAELTRQTIKLALAKDVAIGAHPGLPDRDGAGRRDVVITAEEAAQVIATQLAAFKKITDECGAIVRHVKPHGALYNLAACDAAIARAVANAVHAFDPTLILFGLANSKSIAAARAVGLKTAAEAFADRAYSASGALVSRSQPDALISEPAAAAQRALGLIKEGTIAAQDGSILRLHAETLCVHGDTPHALELLREIHATLRANGIAIKQVER